MTAKEKHRQQLVNRRKLHQALKDTHTNLADLLTAVLAPQPWNLGTPLRIQDEFRVMQDCLAGAATLGWQKGVRNAPNVVTTTGKRVWRALTSQAHNAGWQIGQRRFTEMAAIGNVTQSPAAAQPTD